MKTFGLIMMVFFIITGIAGLISMIYGFSNAKNVIAKMEKTDSLSTNSSLQKPDKTNSYKLESESGFNYEKKTSFSKSYTTEWDIAVFNKALQNNNPKAKNDAFIVFGIIVLVISIFLAVGWGLIAYKKLFGWVFVVLVTGIAIVTAREFITRW